MADAPWWHDVARPVLDPWPRRVALAAHRATFEQQFCTPALTHGADWICTWKCALRLWPDSPSFSNQVLRYWRKPDGLDHERGLPAHRAFPDAYVTAFHLRDMLNEASVAQLIEWSSKPGLLPRVRYGPDRGKDWREIERGSLIGFLTDRDPDVRFTAETELARRRGGGDVGKPTRAGPAALNRRLRSSDAGVTIVRAVTRERWCGAIDRAIRASAKGLVRRLLIACMALGFAALLAAGVAAAWLTARTASTADGSRTPMTSSWRSTERGR